MPDFGISWLILRPEIRNIFPVAKRRQSFNYRRSGFIGFHTSQRLCNDGYIVVGIDNLNDYYDVELRKERIRLLSANRSFAFVKANIAVSQEINQLFEEHNFTYVVNLAAQAGVRYSIDHPHLIHRKQCYRLPEYPRRMAGIIK